jgi:hypothetical protein
MKPQMRHAAAKVAAALPDATDVAAAGYCRLQPPPLQLLLLKVISPPCQMAC